MELRWLTTEERSTRTVDSGTLPEILALAQKLQAEGERSLAPEQVVEMGAELGIEPRFIEEALRLRQKAAPPRPVAPAPPAVAHAAPAPVQRVSPSPVRAVARLFVSVGAVGLLPSALSGFAHSNADPAWFFFTLAMAGVAGWTSRRPRLGTVAGVLSVPLMFVITVLFHDACGYSGIRPEDLMLAFLFSTPMCGLTGRLAAKLRSRFEQSSDRPRLPMPDA